MHFLLRFCGFFDFSHSFLMSSFPVPLSTLIYLPICLGDHLGHLSKHGFLDAEPLTCLVPWFSASAPLTLAFIPVLPGVKLHFSPLLQQSSFSPGVPGPAPPPLPLHRASSSSCSWDCCTLYHSRNWLRQRAANSV